MDASLYNYSLINIKIQPTQSVSQAISVSYPSRLTHAQLNNKVPGMGVSLDALLISWFLYLSVQNHVMAGWGKPTPDWVSVADLLTYIHTCGRLVAM